ncbi:General substrate transporter [Penicillium cataractarum]|uniref:General substrate transporter n=1 Tax=Penicillium cataractarum TaxID=2100454 RepID=A0A9W9VG97_9EURO|nr:General substrate transporter [Penicillium cataractarum]KAJ5378266.1 General substrate transporter [Penicillium cataractarum]
MFENLRGRALRASVAVSAGSAYLLFGYDQGVLGGLVSQPSFLGAIGNPSPTYLGTIVALYDIGCLVGCIIAAAWGNHFGRCRSIFWASIIMVIGATIQTTTYGAVQLIIGRLISGVGNGINTSTVPMYVSEISRTESRGRSLAVQMSLVIFGTVIAYWLDYGMVRNLSGEVVWRFPIAFQIFFALITISTILFLPESPRWLFAHDRREESTRAVSRLLGCDESDERVQKITCDMEEALMLERRQPKLDFRSLLKSKSQIKPARRLVLCFLIQFFQQWTGINVIAFYVTIVLESNVGLSKETSSLVAGIVQICFWCGTLPVIFLLDRLGRRIMLLSGSVALFLSMTLFTFGIAIDTTASAKLALAMLFCYEFSFGMSWNAIPWLYAPEITPLNLRHIGSALCALSEWLWTFVIAQMAPTAIANTGWKIWLLFDIMLLISFFFVFFFLPETSGKTLEEIDYIYVKPEVRYQLDEVSTSADHELSKSRSRVLVEDNSSAQT